MEEEAEDDEPESRQLHLAKENSCRLSAWECKTSSALNQQ